MKILKHAKPEYIGAYAFCKSELESIDLPEVKIIKKWAFLGCKNLMSIGKLRDDILIEKGAFNNCSHLVVFVRAKIKIQMLFVSSKNTV